MKATEKAYEIEVLEGVEAVRRRPGMYVGDVHDGSGLHHALWEIVDHALARHHARLVRHVRIDVDGPFVTVEDDGPGLPGATLDPLLATLHVGDCWSSSAFRARRAFGLGLSVINAVCARFEVESRIGGQTWRVAFEHGRCVERAAMVGLSVSPGLRVRFRPDPEIFERPAWDVPAIDAHLRELAWLHPLLELRWQGAVLENREGLRGWVATLAGRRTADVHFTEDRRDGAIARLAIAWHDRPEPLQRWFVNAEEVPEGDHVRGFWEGIADAAGVRASVARERLEPGMVVVLDVAVDRFDFYGCTRERLVCPEARLVARQVARRLFRGAFTDASRIQPRAVLPTARSTPNRT